MSLGFPLTFVQLSAETSGFTVYHNEQVENRNVCQMQVFHCCSEKHAA